MSIEFAPERFISHYLPEESFCSFLITPTELCGSVPPLQLAHPLANEPRAISGSNAPRIEGCKERDRLAVYECYFSQIKRHRIRLFCKEVVDHVYVHFLMTCKGVQLIDRDRLVQLLSFVCLAVDMESIRSLARIEIL